MKQNTISISHNFYSICDIKLILQSYYEFCTIILSKSFSSCVSFSFRISQALVIVTILIASSLASLSTSKNHELLSKIGLTRVRTPQSHHRKRLAVQSRHHSRSDDSHMFIIKLPPNPHYYGFNNPNSIEEPSKKKRLPIGKYFSLNIFNVHCLCTLCIP